VPKGGKSISHISAGPAGTVFEQQFPGPFFIGGLLGHWNHVDSNDFCVAQAFTPGNKGEVSFKSPINGALVASPVSHPGVNAWAGESPAGNQFTMKFSAKLFLAN
jgi:hypothetical protein